MEPQQRPSSARLAASIGGLMILIPIVLVLGALFIGIAIAGGWYGAVTAAIIVAIVVALVRRARQA